MMTLPALSLSGPLKMTSEPSVSAAFAASAFFFASSDTATP